MRMVGSLNFFGLQELLQASPAEPPAVTASGQYIFASAGLTITFDKPMDETVVGSLANFELVDQVTTVNPVSMEWKDNELAMRFAISDISFPATIQMLSSDPGVRSAVDLVEALPFTEDLLLYPFCINSELDSDNPAEFFLDFNMPMDVTTLPDADVFTFFDSAGPHSSGSIEWDPIPILAIFPTSDGESGGFIQLDNKEPLLRNAARTLFCRGWSIVAEDP